MKKVLSLVCCLCLVWGLCCSGLAVFAAEETTYTVAEMAGKYKTQGRVYNDGIKLYVDWSASGIEFIADCEGDVYVDFEVSANYCYFTVIVDGVKQERDFCKLGQTTGTSFKIASGLSAGTHRFEIYRQTEIGTQVKITGVKLNGTLKSAPANNDLYIEYIGDSITASYGNLATSSTANSGTSEYMDATQGYAYLTAKALGADYSLVAIQGIGALTGWQSYNMQTMYPLQRYPANGTLAYDFARQPDVVVLALGTNDMNRYAATGYTLEQVKQGFADMLALAREKNPNAKIVWIHGMMTGGADTMIQEVIAEAGGAEAGCYTLSMPRSTNGGNGHPTAAQQQVFADRLAPFVEDLLTENDPNMLWMENFEDAEYTGQGINGWTSKGELVADPVNSGNQAFKFTTALSGTYNGGNMGMQKNKVYILSYDVYGANAFSLYFNGAKGLVGAGGNTVDATAGWKTVTQHIVTLDNYIADGYNICFVSVPTDAYIDNIKLTLVGDRHATQNTLADGLLAGGDFETENPQSFCKTLDSGAAIVNDPVNLGNRVLKFDAGYENTQSTWYQIQLGLKSNTTYKIIADVYGGAIWMYINGTAKGITSGAGDWKIEATAAGEWQTVEHTVTTGTFVSDTYTFGFRKNPSGVVGETYLDNIRIVEVPAVTLGDANGDGTVDNKDAGLLTRYLNGWDVTVDTTTCDVNGDGAVDNKDAGLLTRYLNGWDVIF